MILAFIFEFIAEMMFANLTDSTCPNCSGELSWSKILGEK